MERSSSPDGRTDVPGRSRPLRSDAQRNVDALLKAAMTVFAGTGVDAPAKEIADLAGVGVGTVYRHFPRRADLITAVLEHEIDTEAAAAPSLLAGHAPGDALTLWLLAHAEFLANKPRLAPALHSGDPAFKGLPEYFWQRLGPALTSLLDAAAAAGEIRADASAHDILTAISDLSHTAAGKDPGYGRRMVTLLIDGLRYRPALGRGQPGTTARGARAGRRPT